MHLPVRFVMAVTFITDPDKPAPTDELYDAKLHDHENEEVEVKTSIDLWQVSEITEGWYEKTVVLHYYSGETRTVKGTFSEWYDKHVTAKMDELQLVRFPALN
jgi:hypothetical protein